MLAHARICHIQYGMKMTMYIDEALLKGVMERYGLPSKTKAVDFALREVERKARLKEFAVKGLGLTVEELKDAVDPAYDVESLRGRGEEGGS